MYTVYQSIRGRYLLLGSAVYFLFFQYLLKMCTYGAFVLKFVGIIFAAAAAARVQNNVEKTDPGKLMDLGISTSAVLRLRSTLISPREEMHVVN